MIDECYFGRNIETQFINFTTINIWSKTLLNYTKQYLSLVQIIL